MEAQLSLGDVTKSVFTPDFSSTYKSLSAGSTLCNMLTANTIKQSISVDSSNKSEIKDSEFKIKEAEKIISKNILFSIYDFYITSKYCSYSSYLGKNIHTYDYTNLNDPDVPSFKKLNLYLDQINIILDNHKGIVASKDSGNRLYNSLQEFITEIKSSSENIYSIVMGNKIANIESDNFIINAEKLFKGETAFKTKKFTGDKSNIASYFNSVKSKYLDMANSVIGYNEGLQKSIISFNKVMDKLATEYKSSYSQVALQIEYKKEELRNVLYSFAMKYFNIANILYSIKAECIHEYLNPSYSDYDDFLTIKENNSLEEFDDNLFDESTDLFEDTDDISGDDRQVDFSYKTIELEEAFFAYTIKPLLEGPQAGAGNTGTANPPPTPAGNAVVSKPNGGGNTETKDGKTGTGDTAAPADASKKVAGTKDNPASADKDNYFDKGGKTEGFGKTLKDLWSKIMNFMQKLAEKVQFAVTNSKNKLAAIINDLDSIKKINANLNDSDNEYTFRIYNAGVDKTNKCVNSVNFNTIDKVININNADQVKSFNPDTAKQDLIKTISEMNHPIMDYFKAFPDIKIEDNNDFFKSDDAKMVLKNYFAGYAAPDVKNAFNDIKTNTEGKANNNIMASTINIAQIKQTSVNSIINNLKTLRTDQLFSQYNNIKNNGTSYVNKLASLYDSPNAKAEAAKVTMESVMSEYFGDIYKGSITSQQEADTDNTIDIKPVTALINSYINNYIDPIFTCACRACQQMYNNYYNIFNALLSNPLKTGEANNQGNNEQPAQNGQNTNPQQADNNNQGQNAEGNNQGQAPQQAPAKQ